MKNIAQRNKNKISVTQFHILFWGALFSPMVELLLTVVGKTAPRGGFLAPLVALPILLLLGYVLRQLSGENNGFIQGIEGCFNGFSAKIVFSFYLVWGILLLALRLQLSGSSFSAVGYKEGSQYFLLPLLAIFVGWMGGISFSGFARGASLFFGGLLLMFLLVLGLSVRDVEVVRVLPFWWEDSLSLLEAALLVLGIFSYLIYGSFFLGEVEWSEEEGKNARFWISWCVAGCVLLSIFLFVGTGVLGSALLAELADPFYQLAKGVRVQGAFQRMETFVTALWLLADFILLGVLLRGCCYLGEKIFEDKKKIHSYLVCAILLISTGIALYFPSLREYSGNLILVGNLTLGCAIPLGLFFVKKVLHFPRERDIMLEQ